MTTDSGLSDADWCAAITRRHARTFAAASRFLPGEKRRAAFAVYAFCRVADDFVDEALDGLDEAERRLDHHALNLQQLFQGETRTPLFRELRWAMDRYDIPAGPFAALIDMLRTDLKPVEFRDWVDLEKYCGGVASTVGEMCAYVFGMPALPSAREDALRCARVLGVALQLTNILRDVGEDAARGRCYLPNTELNEFGIDRDEILGRTIRPHEARWQEMMRFQIVRARGLYSESEPGIQYVDHDARCCATICASGYAGILRAIERRSLDTLTGRAHIGTARKMLVMFNAWRTTRASGDGHSNRIASTPEKAPIRA